MTHSAVTIFHYHLERGGVTNVIGHQIRAIREFMDGIECVTVVSGRRKASLRWASGMPTPSSGGTEVRAEVLEEIDYLDTALINRTECEASATILAELLRAKYRDSVWWIHNYHLGKNPVFTEAVLQVARDHPDQPMVFHIHDFPETGRFENLSSIVRLVSSSVYPISQAVKYAVLSPWDKSMLTSAGVPDYSVYELYNPVAASPVDRRSKQDTKELLQRSFVREFREFGSDLPVMLYPVRTIRRKNVFEAMMISVVSRIECNLVLTLPGTSPGESSYSDRVATFFKRGLVRGLCHIGERLSLLGLTFDDLVASADLVVSTSIQEGFGFLYVESILRGLPLLARRIDVLRGFRSVLEGPHVGLFDRFVVPMELETRRNLEERYRGRLESLRPLLGSSSDRLSGELSMIFAEEGVDFSYLDVSGQSKLLESAARDKGVAEAIREANTALFERESNLIEESRYARPAPVEDRFSFKAFAQTTRRILESIGSGENGDGPSILEVVEQGVSVEHLRLLIE